MSSIIDEFILQLEGINENAELVKKSVLDGLIQDGFLSKEEAEAWCQENYVMAYRQSWWKKLKGDKSPRFGLFKKRN